MIDAVAGDLVAVVDDATQQRGVRAHHVAQQEERGARTAVPRSRSRMRVVPRSTHRLVPMRCRSGSGTNSE